MRTVSQTPLSASTGAAVAPGTDEGWRDSSEPDTANRRWRLLDLARPWNFPAGHADSIVCRRHLRSHMQVPVAISLHRQDGSFYDHGTGIIRDLSYSGLRLDDVFLARGRLLAMDFGINLHPALEPADGYGIAGRILRTFSSGVPGFGIEFLLPGSGVEKRLRMLGVLGGR